MTFPNPYSTKTPGVSSIGAVETNNAGIAISRALDGTGGGTYTPSAVLKINGLGLATDTALSTGAASSVSLDGTIAVPGAMSAGNVTMTGTNNILLTSRSVSRSQPISIEPFWTSGTMPDWLPAGIGTSVATILGPIGRFHIKIPHGQGLTAVRVSIAGVAGHSAFPGGKPANMPTLIVYSVASADGTPTSLGSQTDTSATAAAYEAWHDLTVSGISHTANRSTSRIIAYFTGEFGANSILGMAIGACTATFTAINYDED